MDRALIAALAAVPLFIMLLPAFAVAGALRLFALAVRSVGALLEPRFVPWTDLMTFDRLLGWKPRPNLDAHYLANGDDVFRIVTDQEGWPGTRSLDSSPVIVIGDSFAFGYGVDAGRSFADLDPLLPIKGVGAPGYSTVQGVLLMEQLAQRLSGKLIVWFICLENDLQDSVAPGVWRYPAPCVRPSRAQGEWEIVNEHVLPTPWQCPDAGWTRTFPHLCAPGPLADRAYAGCDYVIGRAAASCQRVGARLVVVTIPDPIQLTASGRAKLAALSGRPETCDVNLPDRRIAESCRRYGVPLVAGMDHLTARDYKRHEALHWNEQGHRRMAKVLRHLYESFRAGNVEAAPVCVGSGGHVAGGERLRVASRFAVRRRATSSTPMDA